MKTAKWNRLLTGVGLGICLGSVGLLVPTFNGVGAEPVQVPELKVDKDPISRDLKLATSFAEVVRAVSPSVVSIYTTRMTRALPDNLLQSPNLRRFFGIPDEGGSAPRMRQEESLGSGVIVSEDGYILTNSHVAGEEAEIKVILPDDTTEYPAKVIGRDPQTDLAVLKIEAEGLPAITLTDSDNLEVGDVVLAIGNPFDVGQTVTMGIVSALGRGVGLLRLEDYIQTDASINPGNSGGALVDAEGRLLGINTFIISGSGGNQGIGFAIPSNMAQQVMTALIRDGKVSRGFLGVELQAQIDPELAEVLQLEDSKGALITAVVPDTPAEEAGLKPGDVIVRFDGEQVDDRRHLQLKVARLLPGQEAAIEIMRDGVLKTKTLTLGEFPGESLVAGAGREESPEKDNLWGVEVSDLTESLRSQYRVPVNVEGALVLQVDPESPSYEAGVREGVVILDIDGQSVEDADDAVRLSRSDKIKLVVRIWSNTGTRYLVVDGDSKE